MTAQSKSPNGAAQRQARYRARHALRPVELSAPTRAALAALRARLGLGADQVIARALARLAAELDRVAAPPPGQDGPSTPTRNRRGRETTLPPQSKLPF